MRFNRVTMMFIAVGSLALGSSGALPAQAAPAGATAKCGDGTDSKAKTKQGACSKHKGVAEWYSTRENAAATLAPAPAGATAQCKDGSYSTPKPLSVTSSMDGGGAVRHT